MPEHHGDPVAPRGAKFFPGADRHINVIHEYFSGGWYDQAVQHRRGSRLSRAGQPHDDEKFTLLYFEAHAWTPTTGPVSA